MKNQWVDQNRKSKNLMDDAICIYSVGRAPSRNIKVWTVTEEQIISLSQRLAAEREMLSYYNRYSIINRGQS